MLEPRDRRPNRRRLTQADTGYAIQPGMRSRRLNAGELLRQRRLAHGLSQSGLAVRAGTRQATISRIENGQEIPTTERLAQLLLSLGERLELGVVALDAERPSADARADLAKTMAARLEDGFALSAFASQLAGRASL